MGRPSEDLLLNRTETPQYPSTVERVIRTVRDVAAIVALLLVSLLMLSLIQAFGKISDGVDRINAPGPTQTECVGELC